MMSDLGNIRPSLGATTPKRGQENHLYSEKGKQNPIITEKMVRVVSVLKFEHTPTMVRFPSQLKEELTLFEQRL